MCQFPKGWNGLKAEGIVSAARGSCNLEGPEESVEKRALKARHFFDPQDRRAISWVGTNTCLGSQFSGFWIFAINIRVASTLMV